MRLTLCAHSAARLLVRRRRFRLGRWANRRVDHSIRVFNCFFFNRIEYVIEYANQPVELIEKYKNTTKSNSNASDVCNATVFDEL